MTFSDDYSKIFPSTEGGFGLSAINRTCMVISRLNVTRSHYSVDFFMIDFENFKVNCSQIKHLMGNVRWNKPPTESEIKKLFGTLGRDYGELSEAMKSAAREILKKAIDYDPKMPSGSILNDLVLIYAYEMYGKSPVPKGNESPHQLDKGTMAEPESIKVLAANDGVDYQKNEQLFQNKWFKGIPDVIVRDKNGKTLKIIEVKTSYDLPSFILTKYLNEKQENIYETMGYMDILGCRNAEIVHVLVDMPEKIINFEEKRLRDKYKTFEYDEETILDRLSTRLGDMEYSGVPDEYKIFRRPVIYNKYSMQNVKRRATTSKKWLKNIHDSFTKNGVDLGEIQSDTPEDNI